MEFRKIFKRRMSAFACAIAVTLSACPAPAAVFAETATETEAPLNEVVENTDEGTYLWVDYDNSNPDCSVMFATPTPGQASLETDSTGNKYMKFTPRWLSFGYDMETLPQDGRSYEVSFDFSCKDLITSMYFINLTERGKQNSAEGRYDQFGLLRPTDDGNFQIAGVKTTGMKYEEDKWYHYKLIFNQKTNHMDVVISDKENPENTAVYSGQAGNYASKRQGNMMTPRNYDRFEITIQGTTCIDNILVRAVPEEAVIIDAKTEHAGNVFGADDVKKFDVSARNWRKRPIDASIDYYVINEDDNVIDSGSLGNVQIAAEETKNLNVTVNATRFDVYDIIFKVKIKDPSTGEEHSYESINYTFSISPKRAEGEPLNKLVSASFLSSTDGNKEEYAEEYKELLLQAGFGGARSYAPWGTIENGKKGNYQKHYAGTPLENIYKELTDEGMEIMITMDDVNYPLYTDSYWSHLAAIEEGTPEYDEAWAAYENFIAYMAQTYKDATTYWEILNEATVYYDPEQYCKVVGRAYPIIKKYDPDGIVLGVCAPCMPWSWIEGVLAIMGENYNQYMDAIVLHPYDETPDGDKYNCPLPGYGWSVLIRDQKYLDDIERTAEVLKKYTGRDDVPIYISETGITTMPYICSMKRGAAEMTQLYTATQAQGLVTQAAWYRFEMIANRGNARVLNLDSEGDFGVVGNIRDVVPLAAKPGYIAISAYNKLLTNAELIDKVIADKIEAYRFKRANGEEMIVLWADEEYGNISLDLGTSEIEILDMYSNSEGKISSANGVYDFTAGFEPIYINGSFTKLEKSENGNISVDNARQKALQNDTCTFNITDKKNRNLRVEASGTPYAIVSENAGITNGKGKVVVKTTGDAFEEEPITVKVYDGDNLVYCSRYYAVIEDNPIGVSYSVASDPRGSDRKTLSVSVTNNSAGKILTNELNMDWSKIGGKPESRTIVDLKPMETQTVYFNLPKSDSVKAYSGDMKITADESKTSETFGKELEMDVVPSMTAAYNDTGIKDASVFDGEYKSGSIFTADDELAAAPYNGKWRGADDCSFKGTLLWDEENLYILCDVKDDVFYQKTAGNYMFMGDSLQMGIYNPNMVGGGIGMDLTRYNEIGASLGPNGHEMWRWVKHQSTKMELGAIENFDLKVEREGKHTIYKMAIPWIEAVGKDTVSEGELIRFSIIANDNDGSARYYMEFTKGIGQGKSASKFAEVTLVK